MRAFILHGSLNSTAISIGSYEDGELQAEVSGKLQYAAECTMDFPAVGDW